MRFRLRAPFRSSMAGAYAVLHRILKAAARAGAAVRAVEPLVLLVCAQAAYVVLGISWLGFHLTWTDAACAVAAAVVSEWAFKRNWRFVPWSALAAGLGIAIFFRATNPLYFALCAFLAIASKFIVRTPSGHVFNPSNFGIVVSVLACSSVATIEFTQWGDSWAVFALISAVSLAIALRAGVFGITGSFLVSYALLLVVLAGNRESLFSVHHYGLLSPSFVLFASFMITDPKTAPRGFVAGIVHGVSVALLFFTLEAAQVRYAIFLAPFIIAALNAAARAGTAFVQRHAFRFVPPNTASALLIVGAFSAIMAGVFPYGLNLDKALRVSPGFVLFGVESRGVMQCGDTPAFVPNARAGLAVRAVTTGAAWGDYDNDGFDDLLVSYADRPAVLYKNDEGVFAPADAGVPSFYARSMFFADYDNDRDLDIFAAFVSDESVFGGSDIAVARTALVRVFRNDAGRFTDITEQLGLRTVEPSTGLGTMSFADYDNDGRLDFITTSTRSFLRLTPMRLGALQKSLFDPAFSRETVRACGQERMRGIAPLLRGMASPQELPKLETLLADEYACADIHYDLSLKQGVFSRAHNITEATIFAPGDARLFRNDGGGFREVESFRAMLDRMTRRSLYAWSVDDAHPYGHVSGIFWQPLSFDYDGDGLPDMLLTSDFGSNVLLRNRGAFEFEDVTAEAGLNYSATGMGADVGDYNRDGRPDVIVTNMLRDYLYRSDGGGAFTNLLDSVELGRNEVGWGVEFLDYDLDGLEDIFIVNGDMAETLARAVRWSLNRPLFRIDKLYRNNGDGSFTDATRDLCPDSQSGRPLAVSDYDNDGDPDAFVGNYDLAKFGRIGIEGQHDVLYENTTKGKHYLRVRLEGSVGNAMGIGAVVSVSQGDAAQTRWVVLGNSFNAQGGRTLLFGFGEDDAPVSVSVRWPSGVRTELTHVRLDRTLVVRE